MGYANCVPVLPAGAAGVYSAPMKIEGPGPASGPGKTKKSDKSGTSGNVFGAMLAGDTPDAPAARATQSIAFVDSLLALQGAEDPTARAARRRVRERGESILNELEKLRLAMLSGRMTVGHLIDVADVVASHRDKISDPVLTALMDEIDLRAQVELAKLRVSIRNQS